MKRKPYPSDLSDAEWKLIEPLLPKPLHRGPKANVDLREVVNGIFYLLQEGCRWRAEQSSDPCGIDTPRSSALANSIILFP